MAKALDQTAGLSTSATKLLRDIRSFGWHTIGVFPGQDEEGPEWAYSIGLFHSFAHPEVILLGLPLEQCMKMVNVIGKEVKAGWRYESGHEYGDILQDPYRCVFRKVNQNHYTGHVGRAIWFYENDLFPMLQCFWPDKTGLFPWDAACNDYVKKSQPLLYLP